MKSADQPAHMWSYWREKKGLQGALEDYYPETLKNDPEVSALYYQQKALRERIDSIMWKRAEQWLEENPDYA